jgi:hypothetical protein
MTEQTKTIEERLAALEAELSQKNKTLGFAEGFGIKVVPTIKLVGIIAVTNAVGWTAVKLWDKYHNNSEE